MPRFFPFSNPILPKALVRTGVALTVSAALLACGSEDAQEFEVRLENISSAVKAFDSGTVARPRDAQGVEATADGPLEPGMHYRMEFAAAPGMHLSFASMMIPSNDWFVAPAQGALALFDSTGAPITGDVTPSFAIWDAGTEANEPPGAGTTQPPAGGSDDPADTSTEVRAVDRSAYPTLPALADMVRIELASSVEDGVVRFVATLTNVSDATTLTPEGGTARSVPFSPVAWALVSSLDGLFATSGADRGEGLKELAEMGDPSVLGATMAGLVSAQTLFSPGIATVSGEASPFFTKGEAPSDALASLAEDGDPTALANAIVSADSVFNTPDNATEAAPIGPGQEYRWKIEAEPGYVLHLVSMLIPSNDHFITTKAAGLALFTDEGAPIAGDQSAALSVWDAGSEVDQLRGFGVDQAPFQSGANTGAADSNNTVRAVSGSSAIGTWKLTVTPLSP